MLWNWGEATWTPTVRQIELHSPTSLVRYIDLGTSYANLQTTGLKAIYAHLAKYVDLDKGYANLQTTGLKVIYAHLTKHVGLDKSCVNLQRGTEGDIRWSCKIFTTEEKLCQPPTLKEGLRTIMPMLLNTYISGKKLCQPSEKECGRCTPT